MLECILLAAVAAAMSMALTLVVRHQAPAWGLMDLPDGRRKNHRGAIPLGGGLAVSASLFASLVIWAILSPEFREIAIAKAWYLTGLTAAAAFIAVVGFIDDRKGLRGRQKLFGQFIAVSVFLAFSGLTIDKVRFVFFDLDFGIFALPVTVIWLLGAINALNLLDGIDGLAATLGSIFATAIAAMCIMLDRPVNAFVAAALAGSLIGFLRFNMPPASIFLGDIGSMLIGFLIGTMAIESSIKGPAAVALTVPLAIMAIPFFDVFAAIVRRKLTGRSIYSTDRGHMHHHLMSQGYSNKETLAVISVGGLITCLAALASIYFSNEILAAISIIAVVGAMIVFRIFGFAEFLLLRNRFLELTRSLVSQTKKSGKDRETRVKIQGTRSWDDLWYMVRCDTPKEIVRMKLDVDVPQLHEGYHARWERLGDHDEQNSWSLKLPITHGGQSIGRFEIVGLLFDHDAATVINRALGLHAELQMGARALLDFSQHDTPSEHELVEV
jgi:UDP-GlcNAc:undecaprenyl-phosphate GlcNAc-1-phosphate transferase